MNRGVKATQHQIEGKRHNASAIRRKRRHEDVTAGRWVPQRFTMTTLHWKRFIPFMVAFIFAILSNFLISCEKEANDPIIIDNVDNPDGIGQMAEIGVFTGAYNLQGTFMVDGSGITINNDYQGTTAPGPVWYLSNNEKGVSGGVRLENARKGAGGYKIETNVALDYKYLVMWCQPFSVYIGHGIIKK